MKDRTPLPDFKPYEVQFNVDTITAFLFKNALEVAESMKEEGVAHGEAALLGAAVEFTTKLWAQVSFRAKRPRALARETLEKQIRANFRKYWDEEFRASAPEPKPDVEA